jgi:hypothetical protein
LTRLADLAKLRDVANQTELISSREACEILGIARSTLTYWMLTGRIEPVQTIPGPGTKAVSHLFDRQTVEQLARAA